MRRGSIAGGVLVLLAACLTAGAVVGAAGQGGKFISIDDDPALGDPDAKVTIIEFGDYQCPYCRIFWKDTLPRIKEQYVDTGKVRLVFRASRSDGCSDGSGMRGEPGPILTVPRQDFSRAGQTWAGRKGSAAPSRRPQTMGG